ncbi:MAG TPA: RcnB family protein [Sphingomonas sp.]|jgi:Ni/Co efflux regulator RcnB|uniref:RcnB family protein n=1 Tax=Sphingomonas sp. TaxID=28214 RepID=UPI002EDA8425
MRKLITAVLLAATAFPAAASAQSAGELRRDQREIREEQRELRQARRYGDRGDVREQRRDVRDARQEYREDRRDYRQAGRDDWRGYRQQNRALYARGNWNAPFRYNSFRPGVRIGAPYYQQRFVISDPYRYRLPRPTGYQRWVRHYNDVLLIDTRRGYVVDVLRSFYL